jgi:hypothetical protein
MIKPDVEDASTVSAGMTGSSRAYSSRLIANRSGAFEAATVAEILTLCPRPRGDLPEAALGAWCKFFSTHLTGG